MKKLSLTISFLLASQLVYAAGDVPATYPRTYRDYPDQTTPLNAATLNNEVLRSRRLVIAEDKDVTTPPITCSNTYNGYTYLITAAPSGGWASASSGDIALCTYQDSSASWKFITPKEGYLSYVNDEDSLYYFDGSSWSGIPLGVPTTVTVTANTATNENNKLVFMADEAASGVVALEADTTPTFNPSTNTLTATTFAGALTGNVTGDVTGNSDTTTTASAGDSATAFFSSGTIEQDYGGVGADISGYTGLVGTTTGTPSQVDDSSEVAGFISDETGTGVMVFGTSPAIATPTLTLRDAAAPTADGDITWDTTEEAIRVGDDGAATDTIYPVGETTDNLYCNWDDTEKEIDCDNASGAHNAVTLDASVSSIFNLSTQDLQALTNDPGADSIVFWDDASTILDYFAIAAGIETFLTTPSSANLATALTDETGTSLAVFNTDPTFAGIVTLPSAAAPTTDSDGDISVDTDGWGTNYDAYEVWDGTSSAYMISIPVAEAALCTDGQIASWNTGGVWSCEDDAGGTATSLTGANSETIANGTDGKWTFTGVGGANNEVLNMDLESVANVVGLAVTGGNVGFYDGDSHYAILDIPDITASRTITTPAGDTNHQLVSRTSTDTLTNKTLTSVAVDGTGATLAAGADLIGSSTSDITINTNKFTVAGATGNTVVAGTLGVTGTSTLGVVSGVTNLSVDNLNLNGNAITSTDANGNITITPNGTGDLVLDGLKWPQADGTADYVIKTDGAGQLSFTAQSGSGASTYTVLDDSDISGDAITSAQATPTHYITNDGKGAAADYDLPACSAGLTVYVHEEDAYTITLDSVGDDIIHLMDGTALDAADSIISTGGGYCKIRMTCRDATNWWVDSQVCVWADNGA